MRHIAHLTDLPALVGQEVAVSPWLAVTQAQVNQFADATGDHQWIHVDPVRAAAGPFGAPIAHGFLTLSLLPRFFETALSLDDSSLGVNYGLNKVRFTAPVPVGSRLRGRLHLLACEPLDGAGVQLSWRVTVECESRDRPVCIAEALVRRYP